MCIRDRVSTQSTWVGMNKIVVNYLEKVYITSDAATLIEEMEVHHPAAKILSMAAKTQENEVGDGTNFVLVLAGELMNQAEGLLRMGLHPSEILIGYEKAYNECIKILPNFVSYAVNDLKKKEEVVPVLQSVVATKMFGYEDLLAPLIYDACRYAMPETKLKNFDVESVRVAKILGSSIMDSSLIHGLVVMRGSETSHTHIKNAKVAVFNCPIESGQGETKGTVLLKTADELKNYTKTEEKMMEEFIKGVVDAGVNVVVAGGNVSDVALHFLEKFGVLVTKILSKFELRRIAKATGATMLIRYSAPTPEEIGSADEVTVEEISSTKVTIFRKEKDECRIATVVVRGSTNTLMDDAERMVHDCVNTIKCLINEPRCLPGAGTIEILLSSALQEFAKTQSGLDQYAIEKFGQAFEVIPRTIAENAGHKAEDLIAQLYNETAKSKTVGIDIEKGDIKELKIYDSFEVKSWAIKLALDAVLTVLRIDQLIMAKPAGGPKMRPQQPMDAADEQI
eukprot:TRINITY_DN43_c0_g1_i5.p1 TRINITY_DN43_c0_g1~~TRINITY_DN43_c0_g1_i5.p1  ORF type:complete len:509 (-),score=115.01 TRINITY_DN43_c0_g1_i5:49-1575(-)